MDRDDAILMAYVVAQAATTQGGDFSERFQASLRTKGFVVVPVEATEAMLDAALEGDANELLKGTLKEHVFRAFQEGFNSSLSYMGTDDMADAWEMSDAKARIDAFLKGDGDE